VAEAPERQAEKITASGSEARSERSCSRTSATRQDGNKLIGDNQNIDGVKKLEEALKLYPQSFEANFELGYYYWQGAVGANGQGISSTWTWRSSRWNGGASGAQVLSHLEQPCDRLQLPTQLPEIGRGRVQGGQASRVKRNGSEPREQHRARPAGHATEQRVDQADHGGRVQIAGRNGARSSTFTFIKEISALSSHGNELGIVSVPSRNRIRADVLLIALCAVATAG